MKLSNDYIRGLVDGEGCFSFHTRNAQKTKQHIRKEKIPVFCIAMHERDRALIEAMRDHLKLKNKVYIHKAYKGDGYKRGNKAVLFIRDIGSLKNIIIPFFYKKLKGYKSQQFIEWLEKIGNDPAVANSYKLLYRLYKCGFYDKNLKFLD